jgi:cytoskeletal protein RodZ
MESKNLNDIVIEDADSNKKAQLKNILTLLALLFIILVISIVITKLILGSDTEHNATSLSSDTTAQQIQSEAVKEEDSTNNNAVSAVATGVAATAAATAVAHTMSNRDNKKDTTSQHLITAPERDTASRKKLPLRDHKKDITHTVKKETKKHRVVHRNEYRPTVKKKKIVRTVKKAPVKKETPIIKGYFIKVGAFKDPSNAIKKIKANHLKYKTMDSGKVVRVLVGPYYSQKAAQKDITKVRANIAKDAYITKMP